MWSVVLVVVLLKGLTPMPPPPGLGVWDLGFWALGSGSEIWGLGLGVCDLGSGIWVLGFGVWFWGLGSGFGSGRWSVIWSGGIGTRKLRAGVEKVVLRTLPLRNNCSSGGARNILAPVSGSRLRGPKVVFSREESKTVGPEVVELHQFLTPTRHNT